MLIFFFFFLEYPVAGVASVSDFLMRHDAMVIYFLTFSDFALLLLVGSFSYSDLYIKANYLFCILYDIELRIYFIQLITYFTMYRAAHTTELLLISSINISTKTPLN